MKTRDRMLFAACLVVSALMVLPASFSGALGLMVAAVVVGRCVLAQAGGRAARRRRRG